MTRRWLGGAAVVTVLAVASACGISQGEMSIGSNCDSGVCDPGPGAFGDAATPDGDADAKAGMCPSSACAAPFTTCSTSRFACDIDTANDPNNCGSCGTTCPTPFSTMQMTSRCASGQCVTSCTQEMGDCDGLADNGCETWLQGSPEHCGACGHACPAGVPCLGGICGCAPPLTLCADSCVDLSTNDGHCGACGSACEGSPPGWIDRPSTYNGCLAKACQRKCFEGTADCNGDEFDGCEVNVNTPDDANCGACGNVCKPGTKCRYDEVLGGLRCECPPPTVDCSLDPEVTLCVDFSSDRFNCGGCRRSCPSAAGVTPICSNGICMLACPAGKADCNGLLEDGCESNLVSDPDNCGACGNACSGAVGQPCVDGACAVETCGGPR